MSLDDKDLDHLLALAERAARVGGEIARSRAHGTVTDKGDRDLVSEADIASEEAIRELLIAHSPDIPILGEEGGGPDPATGPVWVVDPIDGTINHLHGLPTYAVTICLLLDGEGTVAATYQPEADAMFTAVKGRGAHRNSEPITCSNAQELRQAVVAIDQFTFTAADPEAANAKRLEILRALIPNVGRLRIHGSSALDLAWVADGRLDACLILANHPWDTSSGVLIAREAGAVASDVTGAVHGLTSMTTMVASPAIAAELAAALP